MASQQYEGYYFADDVNTGMYRPAPSNLGLQTGARERMRIVDTGNVLLPGAVPGGSTFPDEKLVVGGRIKTDVGFLAPAASGASAAYAFSSDATTGMASPADGTLSFKTAGRERLTVHDNGNVGVGVFDLDVPAYALDVRGAAYVSEQLLMDEVYGDSAATPSYSWRGDPDTGVYRPDADEVGVATGGSERVRVTASGNVGIGTSTPAEKLRVVGDVSVTGEVITESDARTKTSVSTIADAGRRVEALRGVTYEKEGAARKMGLLAQDVGACAAEAVRSDATTGMQGVNYSAVIALLVEALKDTRADVRELQARTNGLALTPHPHRGVCE